MSIRKTAFVFPGQGSQAVKLLDSFKNDFSIIKTVFEKGSNCLGYDLWALAQQGPIEKLNQTQYTQPVLLTASFALWQLWKSQGGKSPDFLLGHSLGEYTAYTCADTFSFEEAVTLVEKRGTYMQEAVTHIEGAMAVIVGLSYEAIVGICEKVQENEIVSPSNYNALDQIVVSGHLKAVERVLACAKEKGARLVKRLPISVPAHCALMKPAAQKLAAVLDEIMLKVPSIPVVSNTNSKILSDTKAIQQALLVQLYQPVFWVKNIHYLLKQGVNCFIECGPGQVLTKLIQRIVPKTVRVISIGNAQDFQKALSEY